MKLITILSIMLHITNSNQSILSYRFFFAIFNGISDKTRDQAIKVWVLCKEGRVVSFMPYLQ